MDKQNLNKRNGLQVAELFMTDNGKQEKTFNRRKVKGLAEQQGWEL